MAIHIIIVNEGNSTYLIKIYLREIHMESFMRIVNFENFETYFTFSLLERPPLKFVHGAKVTKTPNANPKGRFFKMKLFIIWGFRIRLS